MFLILDHTSTKWEGDQSSSCNTLLKVFWQVCRNAFVSFKNSCLTLSFSSIIVDLQCTCLMYIISVTIFLVYNYKKTLQGFQDAQIYNPNSEENTYIISNKTIISQAPEFSFIKLNKAKDNKFLPHINKSTKRTYRTKIYFRSGSWWI